VLALAEDGQVYAWGKNWNGAVLGNPHVDTELLPTPVEALRGVRVSCVAAGGDRSYAVADTGQLWAWGCGGVYYAPIGHDERTDCPLPKPIAWLRGIKIDAVAACEQHTLALVDDGSVYAWGDHKASCSGALGLRPSVNDMGLRVSMPEPILALRVACGL
jgi:alpha-tubulin suppressor-like RCC1 family protein